MKNFDVVLGKKVNNVLFGTDRDAVRKVFGKKFNEIKKNIFSKNTMDAYDDFHIYYSKDDTFEAIEIFGKFTVKIEGVKVFPGSVETIKQVITDLEVDGDGYLSRKNSVGITTEGDEIKSILFGELGYYD